VLSELLDGESDEALEAAAGTHLATCDSCRVVVEDTEHLRRASRVHGRLRMPDEARARIREALLRDE
jgi:predicted anti-sigma-YlaC factor YlaD